MYLACALQRIKESRELNSKKDHALRPSQQSYLHLSVLIRIEHSSLIDCDDAFVRRNLVPLHVSQEHDDKGKSKSLRKPTILADCQERAVKGILTAYAGKEVQARYV